MSGGVEHRPMRGVPALADPTRRLLDPPTADSMFATGFIYHGGPILAFPRVTASFWGAKWQSEPAWISHYKELEAFLSDLLISPFMNLLTQYGIGFGAIGGPPNMAGRFMGSTFAPSVSGDLTNGDTPQSVQGIIQQLIDTQVLGEPIRPTNQILAIFLDDTVRVNDPQHFLVLCEPAGDTAFGYHEYFTTRAGNPFYYAVVPALSNQCIQESCMGSANCTLQLNDTMLDRVTNSMSHELAEACTDPEPGSGWYSGDRIRIRGRVQTAGEIGDVCAGIPTVIRSTRPGGKWQVQTIYSSLGDHVGTTFVPAAVCPMQTENPLPRLSDAPRAVAQDRWVLRETALGGPAIAEVVGEGLLLAWTGTDPAHRLNFALWNQSFAVAHKITLAEQSIDGPDVKWVRSEDTLHVAWTGTDPAHSINFAAWANHGLGARQHKFTLHESSFCGPAIARGANTVVAWTANDSEHHLIVGIYDDTGRQLSRQVLSETSDASPALAYGTPGFLFLLWTGTDPDHTLNLLVSTDDGRSWHSKQTFWGERSNFRPGLITRLGQSFLCWGRRDDTHLAVAEVAGSSLALKMSYTDRSAASTSMGTIGEEVFMAFTGVDSDHHINIANIA